MAWVDEIYREAIAGRKRPGLCHACHIPGPLLLDGLARRPVARDADRHYGVSCEACHLGADGVVLGPRGTATDAHPTAASEYLREKSSELCATCHRTNIGPVIGIAKDFEKADMAARGRSCVGCHMAPVERAWANAPGDPADPGGAPVPKAYAELRRKPAEAEGSLAAFAQDWNWAKGNTGGRVLLEAPIAGSYEVVIKDLEGQLSAQTLHLDLPAEGLARRVTLASSPSPSQPLDGRVETTFGEPLPGMRVTLMPVLGEISCDCLTFTVVTDESGSFSFGHFLRGNHQLIISDPADNFYPAHYYPAVPGIPAIVSME